jgi:hypothetical protein
MLGFSGTLVERDSRIAFAAMLDDLRDQSIEGVGQDARRLENIQRFCGR